MDLELLLSFILILVLIRLLFPELFRPEPQTGTISGGLTSAGVPISGATVTLYLEDKITEVAVVTSDAEGKYTLPAVAMGNYHITAILQNVDGSWLQGDADVIVDNATVFVDLTMERIII